MWMASGGFNPDSFDNINRRATSPTCLSTGVGNM
jgi:hypothetical protein